MELLGPDPASLNTHRIATERSDLDLPRESDAAEIYRLVGGPDREEVCATLIWDGPDNLGQVESWIERCRTATFGDWGYHWVIRDRDGALTGEPGKAMGAIGTRPHGPPGRADVGYWLGRPYWGWGVMSEALSALLAFGFDTLNYAKIEAEVFTENERGRRLVDGVGMRHEGSVRRAVFKNEKWVDFEIYGMLPEEIGKVTG